MILYFIKSPYRFKDKSYKDKFSDYKELGKNSIKIDGHV